MGCLQCSSSKAKLATVMLLIAFGSILRLFASNQNSLVTLEEETTTKTKSNVQEDDGVSFEVDNNTKLSLFMEFLNQEHPECVLSPPLHAATEEEEEKKSRPNTKKIVIQNGKYIYKPIQTPLYDHKSCFIMKARYNCAKEKDRYGTPTTTPTSTIHDSAYNYRYVWRINTTATNYCDIRHVFQEYSFRFGNNHDILSLLPSNAYILLQGNSKLRQVFEAFVCIFRNHLQSLVTNVNGPTTTLAAAEARNGRPYNVTELGQAIPLVMNNQIGQREEDGGSNDVGCHGVSDNQLSQLTKMYRTQPPPPTIPSCNDDIAHAIFTPTHNIHLGYLFRPYMYDDSTIQHVHHNRLQLPPSLSPDDNNELNLYVFYNDGETQLTDETSSRINIQRPKINFDFENVLASLKKIQMKSIGKYFGADNPWITDPPDQNHGCMPGIPDDDVYLLLFSLITGYELD